MRMRRGAVPIDDPKLHWLSIHLCVQLHAEWQCFTMSSISAPINCIRSDQLKLPQGTASTSANGN